jgi:hypothetical protein
METNMKRDALHPGYAVPDTGGQAHPDMALPHVPVEVAAEFAEWLSVNGGLAGFSIGAKGQLVWLAAFKAGERRGMLRGAGVV